VNIDREVELSGAIHSKGVLIPVSFLAARYARNQPLALSASLVFEQSYGFIEATALPWPNYLRCFPIWRMYRSGSRWRSPAR